MGPILSESKTCPSCGYENDPAAPACSLCTALLLVPEASAAVAAPVMVAPSPRDAGRGQQLVVDLGLGVLGAALLGWVPMLRFMGWFLASLTHEMSHCAAAWAAGCPAVPAISLVGHAAALHQDQQPLLAFAIWATIAVAAWRWQGDRLAKGVLVASGLLYPFFAFTGAREIAFLLAGQSGEVVFATVFFWRFFVGGFSSSRAEGVAYTTLGSYLIGRGLWLDFGLAFDAKTRAWYADSGSFGLTNDYLRVAHDFGIGLAPIALTMAIPTLAALPVAWWLARRA